MNEEIHISQESPHGWWIAGLIERFEYYDEDHNDPERECLAHRNLILIKANDREEAYSKALEEGAASNDVECVNDDGEKGIWRFEGIETLLPIYDQLEDGAEILCEEFNGLSVKETKKMVKPKEQLESFEDIN